MPYTIFSHFSFQLVPFLCLLIRKIISKGQLPPNMTQATILFLKKVRDTLESRSYCLSTFYAAIIKVLNGVLSHNLKTVISKIKIINNKNNVLHSSYISTRVFALHFDRIKWNYLFMVLWKFGCGLSFTS